MNTPSKVKIAKKIKELRTEKKLTQKELAIKTGLSYSAIISYENAKSEPNSKAMAALEEYFNVSGAYLRGETDKRETLSDEEQDQLIIQQSKEDLSDFLKRIQKGIRAISDDELEFTDGLLIELYHALNIKNKEDRAAALLLLHMSANISNAFFFSYNRFTDELSKEESINKAMNRAIEKYSNSLEYIKNILLKKN